MSERSHERPALIPKALSLVYWFVWTIPMIFGILSMALYNMVDTFFVGQLGKLQLAALAFTFPVVIMPSSILFLFSD
jgi:Na+-driven multidrug efflux pump